jgi:hypothetical protein
VLTFSGFPGQLALQDHKHFARIFKLLSEWKGQIKSKSDMGVTAKIRLDVVFIQYNRISGYVAPGQFLGRYRCAASRVDREFVKPPFLTHSAFYLQAFALGDTGIIVVTVVAVG